MNAKDVRLFIFGKTIYSTDPSTGKFVATVQYDSDGACTVSFADGTIDTGHYGFDDQTYWTHYKGFRAGKKHSFYLQKIDGLSAQAVHHDGKNAYLLSRQPPLCNHCG